MFVTDISVLVVAKIGCENVQLKIKTVKNGIRKSIIHIQFQHR